MANTGNIAVKRIRLDIESNRPTLAGIDQTINRLHRLSGALLRVNTQARSMGVDFSRVGEAGESASLRAGRAVDGLAMKARAANVEISRLSKTVASVGGGAPPVIGGASPDGASGKNTSLLGGGSFLGKVGTAATWIAAYSAISKTLGLTEYSYKRMAELGLQTARLQQVFRGVGGDARQLTDDVLKLAAAEGRNTEEASQSAIAWSRLGLTRRQVGEATKVSLMAANVAEMSADDATQHLSATMAAYNLQASELQSVLGMLNQSSNTYRVTNKDLLEGLSRVSSVAQQAGMSLGELQGIITATVQKTGQSGPNIANAIKTILARINRPDLKQFLGERYGLATTGSAQDLRNMWEIYSKLNDEQARDLTLKVGSATQANRFRAILESYGEAMRATIVAQRNLNSAEQENVLVTNTAAAAHARLVSSWDRLVNSPTANQAAAGVLNIGAGIISGLTNGLGQSKQGRTPIYFDPKKADIWGSLGAMSGFYNVPGLDAWTTKHLGFSTTPGADDKFQLAMQGIYNKRYGAGAEGTRETWLRMLSRNWGQMRPGMQERITQSLGGIVSPETLVGLATASPGAGRAMLSKEADAARERHAQLTLEAEQATTAELAKIQSKKERTAEEDSRIAELLGQQSEAMKQLVDASEDYEQKMERITPFLVQQKEIIRDIGEGIKGFGLSEEITKTISLGQELAALNGLMSTPGISKDAYEALHKDYRVTQAELDYRQSPGGLYRSRARSGASVAGEMAGFETESYGVGLSEGEKQLDKSRSIAAELDKLDAKKVKSQEDLIRGAHLVAGLRQAEFQIQNRILQVEKEKRQVMLEANREFQKTIITAGPGDILRKLATSQLYRSGRLSAGGFFAMGSEMRADAYGLMGGERMASLNWEGRALSGQRKTVGQMQGLSAIHDAESQRYATEYANSVAKGAADAASSMTKAASSASAIEAALKASAEVWGRMNALNGQPGRGNYAPSATPVSQAVSEPIGPSGPPIPGFRQYSGFN